MRRHGGNENEARAIWESYQKEFDKSYTPDARFLFAMEMLELQNSGFPFSKNDITLEQWKYIGEMKTALTDYQISKIKR